jgi:hypothetical protein
LEPFMLMTRHEGQKCGNRPPYQARWFGMVWFGEFPPALARMSCVCSQEGVGVGPNASVIVDEKVTGRIPPCAAVGRERLTQSGIVCVTVGGFRSAAPGLATQARLLACFHSSTVSAAQDARWCAVLLRHGRQTLDTLRGCMECGFQRPPRETRLSKRKFPAHKAPGRGSHEPASSAADTEPSLVHI